MRLEAIERGVQAEYLGLSPIAEDHLEALRAWSCNEPAPSPAYKVGRLTVRRGVLRKVRKELREATEVTTLARHKATLESPLILEHGKDASPFLQHFLGVCGRRFAGIVREDLRRTVPAYEPRITQSIHAGPYMFSSGNEWHRDWATHPGLAWTLTIFGTTTTFATGRYPENQFVGSGRDLFDGPEPAREDTFMSEVGDITVHLDMASLHAAPSEDHDGEIRIFSIISARDALASITNE